MIANNVNYFYYYLVLHIRFFYWDNIHYFSLCSRRGQTLWFFKYPRHVIYRNILKSYKNLSSEFWEITITILYNMNTIIIVLYNTFYYDNFHYFFIVYLTWSNIMIFKKYLWLILYCNISVNFLERIHRNSNNQYL